MRKLLFTLFPFLFAGFILPKDNCHTVRTAGTQVDGPYVIYRNNSLFVNYIDETDSIRSVRMDSIPMAQKATTSISVATDEPGKYFSVPLKADLQNEKAEFAQPSKMFILSDIEGNFKGFRKLLQGNGVIDDKFNWTFGSGHLVLTGDFFDRGDQVTEVLWLIYSLEEKAKAAGGYVHFVLGNHEIMNLSGDVRYVQSKYFQNAALMSVNYMALYDENTELGRWLRTKNVVEKIGDILFAHGGISSLVNSLDIQAPKINKLARPFYSDSTYKYKDIKVEVLYSDLGPFWYRGYYYGTKATPAQIDSTLNIYDVKHIATGHTIIADTISVSYGGKVFNTDVHHAKGLSEGLLVEDGKFYRANNLGERFQIL